MVSLFATAMWMASVLISSGFYTDEDDAFFQKALEEVDSFHHTLSFPLYQSHDGYTKNEDAQSTASKKVKSKCNNHQSTDSRGLNQGSIKSDEEESGKTGYSEKENESKRFGEEYNNKGETNTGNNNEEDHHSSKDMEASGRASDRLLHKKGNYKKGYRNQYHLNEGLKQGWVWSDRHSSDEYHKFGNEGSHSLVKDGKGSLSWQ